MSGAPTIVSIVSEWATSLVLEGCVAGTVIDIGMSSAAGPIASTTASGGRDTVTLLPGKRLIAGSSLRASTWAASQPSVPVMAAPRDNAALPPMKLLGTPYECGWGIALNGGFPGAVAQVLVGANLLGSETIAPDGSVRIPLKSPLPAAGTSFTVAQHPPPGWPALTGTPQPLFSTTVALPTGPLKPLVIPGNQTNVPGCASTLQIGGAIAGAFIRGAFDNGAALSWLVYSPTPLLGLNGRVSNAKLTLYQELPQCRERGPSPAIDVHFGPPVSPPVPTLGPVCAGVTQVPLSSLEPGAQLTLYLANGETLDYTIPPEVTTWAAPVGSLPAGPLTIMTTACGLMAQTSVVVGGSYGDKVKIATPVNRCGTLISVQSEQPGTARCWGKTSDRGTVLRSGDYFISPGRNVLQVTPPFSAADQELWVEVLGCGGSSTTSPKIPVSPNAQEFPWATLTVPVIAGDKRVIVANGIANAIATILGAASGQPSQMLGNQELLPDDMSVGLSAPAQEGQQLWALLQMCSAATHDGHHVTVVASQKTFSQPTDPSNPKSHVTEIVPVGTYAPVSISGGVLTVGFNGDWNAKIFAQNMNGATDIDFLCNLQLVDSGGTVLWGALFDGSLAAANHGKPNGMAVLGIPDHKNFSLTGHSPALTTRAQWSAIVSASLNITLTATASAL